MASDRRLVQHVLAAVAYRLQKAVRDAPAHYPGYSAGNRTRTPSELVRHMTSVLGYARTFAIGGSYPFDPGPLPTFEAELARFHEMLESVASHLAPDGTLGSLSAAQLLQGPLADVMTHVGQLAMLRRLAGAPVAPENFIHADVRGDRLGPDQPLPARPDEYWPDAPA
jgi:hypothetical protein